MLLTLALVVARYILLEVQVVIFSAVLTALWSALICALFLIKC